MDVSAQKMLNARDSRVPLLGIMPASRASATVMGRCRQGDLVRGRLRQDALR